MRLIQISVVLAVFGGSFGSNDISRHSARSEILDSVDIALDLTAEFERFKLDYNRKYSSPMEERKRYRNFVANHRVIQELRASEMGTAEYGFNKFSDLSQEEFRTYYANLDLKNLKEGFEGMDDVKVTAQCVGNQEAFDWRDLGDVTPVKNQSECDSSWAFSAIGQLESVYNIMNFDIPLTSLSAQQLIDCDLKSLGCNGGSMENALDYAIGACGLESDNNYPYKGRKGVCRASCSRAVVKVTKKIKLPVRNETAMAEYIRCNAPVMAAINAVAFQSYFGGIMAPASSTCGNKDRDLNHAVVITGYGYDSREKNTFWIAKNSWGETWGEKGYARIQRGSNTCGIANYVLAGEVENL